MDAAELGKRLREARERVGLNQDVAAQVIGAPRSAISLMESGQRSVSTLELSKLATLYGRRLSAFFEESSEFESVGLLLRRTVDSQISEEERAGILEALALWEEGARLESLMTNSIRPSIPFYGYGVPRSKGEAIHQGEAVAEDERRRLGIGIAPISDVADVMATQSIWISASLLPSDVSGMFIDHRDIGFAILVNASHGRARRRFSYAHEYAHALLDRGRPTDLSSVRNKDDSVEVRANAFAAAFLMPRNGVASVLRQMDKGSPSRLQGDFFSAATNDSVSVDVRPPPGSQKLTYQDVVYFSHHFGVSYQAAVYRLKNLMFLGKGEAIALLGQAESGGEYLRELRLWDDSSDADGSNKRELKLQLTRLAIEAYRLEEISRGRLTEIGKKLDMPPGLLLRLGEAARAQ